MVKVIFTAIQGLSIFIYPSIYLSTYLSIFFYLGVVRGEGEDLADGDVHGLPGPRPRRSLDRQGKTHS